MTRDKKRKLKRSLANGTEGSKKCAKADATMLFNPPLVEQQEGVHVTTVDDSDFSEKSTILIDDDDNASVVDLSFVDYADHMSDVICLGSLYGGDVADQEIHTARHKSINHMNFSYRSYQCTKDSCEVIFLQNNANSYPIVEPSRYLNLLGSVEIFGYDLPRCDKNVHEKDEFWTTVEAVSISSPVLYVRNTTATSSIDFSKFSDSFWQILKEYCNKSDIKEIRSLVQNQSACFIMQKLDRLPEELQFVQKVFNNRTFLPGRLKQGGFLHTSEKSSECTVSRTDHLMQSEIHNIEMNEILFSTENSLKHSAKNFVCALVGPLNVGKSTFLRHLMNKALTKKIPVFHIECDCGQTEFTLPGCLALTKVTKPVFGDSFVHLRNPELCYYFGHVTLASRISEYLDIISRLKIWFEELTAGKKQKSLLVVNTNGWISGPGFETLVKILEILKPNHVTSLGCSDSNGKNEFECKLSQNLPNNVVLHNLQSAVEAHTWARLKNGRFLRELCIVSYFGRLFRKMGNNFEENADNCTFLSLRCVKPYKVDWRRLKIQVLNGHAPPSHLLAILNANLVALCRTAPAVCEKMSEKRHWMDNDQNPVIFKDAVPPECLGFGIVRAINPDEKKLYVITPLTEGEIQSVDVVLKGHSDLPLALFQDFNKGIPFCPYTEPTSTKKKFGASAISRALENPIKLKSSHMKIHRRVV